MLTSLYIKNFALIEELSIEFSSGLTIITGETGAGKSILLGALNQVLGVRSSPDLVRSGCSKAIVEAVLVPEKAEKLLPILEQAGIDLYGEILLRREISVKGQSRCFVNDSPCTLQVLKQVGDLLIDLHGQHEHQLLLHPETHVSVLDDFGQLDTLVGTYKNTYSNLKNSIKELDHFTADADRLKEKRDLLEYQLNEIRSLDLKLGELEEVEQEITLHEHAETRFSLSRSLNELLYDSDRSAFVQLSEALEQLRQLEGIDKSFSSHLEDAESARSLVEELSRFIQHYSESIEFNPERLEMLRERLMQLQRIGKKYGRSIEELVDFEESLSDELAMEDNLSERIKLAGEQIASLRNTLSGLAAELSAERRKTAEKLELAVADELGSLGIPNCVFSVKIHHEQMENGDITLDGRRYSAFENGCDRIEFLISTNIGESPKPLAKIASGGEISRIMLALKSILAEHAQLPILIFDEIDTGISGSIAEAVGRTLRNLSRTHQIISITHLPQIAAMADRHLSVEKTVLNNRTATQVRVLDDDEHVSAVAKLIGGSRRSESTLRVAAELVEHAKTMQ